MNHPGCVCGDALEAENAKLREALEKIAAGGHTHAADEIRIAREALAVADEGEQ